MPTLPMPLPMPMPMSMPMSMPAPGPGARQRRAAAAGLAALVLFSHLWLLGHGQPAPGPSGGTLPGLPATLTMQVRQIAQLPKTPEPSATVATPMKPPNRVPKVQAALLPRPAPVAAAASPGPDDAGAADFRAARPTADRASSVNTDTAAGADRASVPIYATQYAPPVTLHFELQRGTRRGAARLQWQPDETGYALDLAVAGGELTGLGAASRGAFDPAGLAPDRFVDRRRGRDVRAANFRRDLGSVSFSATAQDAQLQRGMQDRLSWMLQLPAVLQANPDLATAGAEVSMWVAGARGRADVWTFSVVGTAALALNGGEPALLALHLRRSAAQAYDTQIDVWLDPARQHLPVRVRLASPPGDWTSELQLTGLVWTVP